jgi:hypothetical protein
LSGGQVQTLCDAPSGRGGTWNKDGVATKAFHCAIVTSPTDANCFDVRRPSFSIAFTPLKFAGLRAGAGKANTAFIEMAITYIKMQCTLPPIYP